MGVAGEIGKHCFWPGEGRLGVDEPVLSLERREMRGEGLAPTQALDLAKKCQSARRVGIGKRCQEQPPEQAGTHYRDRPPRARLSQLEQEFLSRPWAQVRDSVQVKLIEQDGELFILARSGGRRDKEQAMRRRRLKKLVKRLHEL